MFRLPIVYTRTSPPITRAPRAQPFRVAPFRVAPFLAVPFRAVPFRAVPFRAAPRYRVCSVTARSRQQYGRTRAIAGARGSEEPVWTGTRRQVIGPKRRRDDRRAVSPPTEWTQTAGRRSRSGGTRKSVLLTDPSPPHEPNPCSCLCERRMTWGEIRPSRAALELLTFFWASAAKPDLVARLLDMAAAGADGGTAAAAGSGAGERVALGGAAGPGRAGGGGRTAPQWRPLPPQPAAHRRPIM